MRKNRERRDSGAVDPSPVPINNMHLTLGSGIGNGPSSSSSSSLSFSSIPGSTANYNLIAPTSLPPTINSVVNTISSSLHSTAATRRLSECGYDSMANASSNVNGHLGIGITSKRPSDDADFDSLLKTILTDKSVNVEGITGAKGTGRFVFFTSNCVYRMKIFNGFY